MDKYKLCKDVQLYFDYHNHKSLFGKQYLEFNDNYFSDLFKNLNYVKEEIDIKLCENNGAFKTVSTDIQNNEENNFEIDNPNLANKTTEDKNELFSKELAKLKAELKNDLLIEQIERSYSEIKILEKLILNLEINSIIINIDNKRIQYLENVISSLKNTIINLGNPYNFNLWRKLANIILKNIFVVLFKKNYIITQFHNNSVLNQLKFHLSKLPEDKLNSYKIKIKDYENKLKTQNLNIMTNETSASDKDRKYNLIVIKNEIKYTLVIEFLFYLKEKGNKINHFDQEVIDLILFDDLNIKVIKNEEEVNKGNGMIIENENENHKLNEKYTYEGKTMFKGFEIIEMLKHPFKFHKDEIDMNKIYSLICDKIKELKDLSGYNLNDMKFSDLKYNAIKLEDKIKNMISSYEKYYNENNIDYKSGKEIFDNNIKESIEKYNHIKEIKENIRNKIKLYINIEEKLNSLNDLSKESIQKIDEFISEIKNQKKAKQNLLSLLDIFNEFKKVLKTRIKRIEEYKKYEDIFNERNIDQFKIDDVYSFLKEHLSYNDANFSIIKKDIVSYNFLVAVITEYNDFKDIIYNKDLDILI